MERRTTEAPQNIISADAPRQSCIAVCQKCAGKLNLMDGEKSRLRVALKELIALKDLKKKVRAVDASCFDLCPEGKITVIHFTPQGVTAVNADAEVTAPELLTRFGY